MATVVPFPLDRFVGKARHVAAMINRRRTSREREVYFQATCKQLAKQQRRAGIPEREIDHQLRLFTAAVNQCIGEGWHFETDAIARAVALTAPARPMSDLFDENQHPPGAA